MSQKTLLLLEKFTYREIKSKLRGGSTNPNTYDQFWWQLKETEATCIAQCHPNFTQRKKIQDQAGIEPTTLGVLAHYSNHWATEALVVEKSLFDYIGIFSFFHPSSVTIATTLTTGHSTGECRRVPYLARIPRDPKPINAEQINYKGREHQSKCLWSILMYCPMPSKFHTKEKIQAQAGIVIIVEVLFIPLYKGFDKL